MEKYSVLMSVHEAEKPEYLDVSVRSMMDQTVAPSDFVLVCDGTLTPDLDEMIDSFEKRYPGIFQVVRTDENKGIGAAANEGLRYCRHGIIVKMDADDISVPDRCEKQLRCFEADPDLSIVGGYIEEFSNEDGAMLSVRTVPEEDKDIHVFARRRAPFNNQTIAYRKAAAEKAGGYSELRRCEDHEFAVRLLASGAKACNIPDVLVRYRLTDNHYARRRSWENTKAFLGLHYGMWQSGFCGFLDFLVPSAAQLVLFATPWQVTSFFYRRFLRKPDTSRRS